MIKNFGATDTLNAKNLRNEEVVNAVRDLTEGFNADVAMEVARSGKGIRVAVKP